MSKEYFHNQVKIIYHSLFTLFILIVIILIGIFLYTIPKETKKHVDKFIEIPQEDNNSIVNGKHTSTGLVDGEGLSTVLNNCISCHSAKIITQNRMSKDMWRATIKWMQETQNLWDLGENEDVIVNYLSINYAPKKEGRRTPLTNIEWYILND
jgi:hypothetical protein